MAAKLNHIKELDGARGIAVIVVMLFHFVHIPFVSENRFDLFVINFLHLGWIGVDLFFVLSGFLITRILIHEKREQKFSKYLSRFYAKRSLRIFPLYYAYLIFIFLIFLPLFLQKLDHNEQLKLVEAKNAQLWFWLYVSNIKQVVNGKFFGAGVSHLWSLSIEEQFYLFWPLIVYYFKLANIKRITIGIIILSPLLRIICLQLGMPLLSIYFFTFTRLDALSMGALVAILSIQNVKIDFLKLIRFIVFLSIVSIVIIYYFGIIPESSPVICSIGYSLLALTFGCLILLLQSTYDFKFRSFFNTKYLTFMGKYSYGLYLFHPLVRNVVLRILGNPFVILGSQILWTIFFIILSTGLSIILALLSWNLFEKWFLKLKDGIKSGKADNLAISQ